MNFTAFWIYDFIQTYFVWVTTLSQKLIIARVAESNRDGIFSKSLVDAGCDNIPKSQKKIFFEEVWVTSFCFFTVDTQKYGENIARIITTNGTHK